MASNLPTLTVEWSPTGLPNDASPTWVSMTAYVSEGSTKRGRQYELDRFVAGIAPLTLRTTTRLFDPEYAAGTYFGQLLPMKQIRITATWNAVTYPIWRGFVTSWGTTAQDDKVFVTTIATADAFARFEQVKLPSSAWALEINQDSPSAWFRLGESDTPRITDNTANGNYGLYDNCQQGQQGLVVNDSDGAASFAHSLEERAVIQNPNLITGYPFTVSMMFQIDNSETGGMKVMFAGLIHPTTFLTALTAPSAQIVMDGGGALTTTPGAVVLFLNDGTNIAYVWTSVRADDNRPHHIAAVASSSNRNTWILYLDGVDVTTRGGGTNPSWPGQPPNGWTLGNYTDLSSGDFGFGANADALGVASQQVHRGTIDEVCVWNGAAVSSARIAAHALAARTGRAGEDISARLGWLLDRISWPAGLRTLATGASTLGAVSWSEGSSALAAMQGWADTELGDLFIGADGSVVSRSRHYPLLNARAMTSQATFGDAHSAATLKFDRNGFELLRDETQIRNPVTASRKDGVTVTVSDAALVSTYGDRTWSSPTTEDSNDAAVRDRAAWLLARYKDLHTRLAKMTITPQRDPSNLWPVILGLEIGDRITVKQTPAGMGAEISIDFIIQSIEHRFSAKTLWVTTFTGAPVDPSVGQYLILDDAVQGLIGGASTFTVLAATDVFTVPSSLGGIENGTPVVLSGLTGATGVTAGPTYYVVNSTSTGGTFKLAATLGGAAINITADGSGTVTAQVGQLLAY